MANGPNTVYSLPSLLTSRITSKALKPRENLASILKKYGYATAAFNPNPVIFYRKFSPAPRIDQDFDLYDMHLSSAQRNKALRETVRTMIMRALRERLQNWGGIKNHLYRFFYLIYDRTMKRAAPFFYPSLSYSFPSAEELNHAALEWVKRQKSRFFLWIHYMDVHEPYLSAGESHPREIYYLVLKSCDFPSMLNNHEIQELIVLYDKKILEVDLAIGSLLDSLQALSILDDCLIILAADHGESFGEHGALGHGGPYKAQLYDELLHVPLILSGIRQKGQVQKLVQLLDVAPTICELFHIPLPPDFKGQSLFSPAELGVISNTKFFISYRTSQYKLIINKSFGERSELYDLRDDPGEKINLVYHRPDIFHHLAKEMIVQLEKYKEKEIS